MRKRLLLTVALLLLLSSAVFAHPGRTDANGGHWNRQTGEYHFHSGKYAGKSSSGSSSSSVYIPFTPPYEPPTDNPYKNEKTASNDSDDLSWGECIALIIFIVLLVIPIIYNAVCFLYDIIGNAISDKLPSAIIKRYKDKLYEFKSCQDYINESLKCIEEYERIIEELSFKLHIPEEYEIGKDGLPKEKNCSKWGDLFTVYKSPYGRKIHRKYMCCNAITPVHIVKVCRQNAKYDWCKKCYTNDRLPDLTWYEEYLEYQHEMRTNELKKMRLIQRRKSEKESRCSVLGELEALNQKCNSRFFRFLIFFSKNNKQKLKEAKEEYKILCLETD